MVQAAEISGAVKQTNTCRIKSIYTVLRQDNAIKAALFLQWGTSEEQYTW